MSLCFLLAAGQGTRLRPFTEHKPKPTLPFLTMPLAHYGFYLARKGGFGHFLMNKHHLPEQIDVLAEELSPWASSVTTVDETSALLGSGGALWNARETLAQHDYFLVANGDEILFPEDDRILEDLVSQFKRSKSLCTLLTCDHPELLKSLKPVWVDRRGDVKAFGMERPNPDLKPVHYTGYKVFSKKILDWLPAGESNIFYDVLTRAIDRGETVSTHHMSSAHWHETGNFNSFLVAQREVVQHNWDALQKRRTFFRKPILHKQMDGANLLVSEDPRLLKYISRIEGTVVLSRDISYDGTASLKNLIAFEGADLNGKPSFENKFVSQEIL